MTSPIDTAVRHSSPRLVRVSSSPLGGATTGTAAPRIERERRTIGGPHLRLVTPRRRRGSPALFVVAAVVVGALFGLAAFHSMMASAQYDLEKIERELTLEQARLVDLEFQVERLNSPARVEQLARGALGMQDPTEAVDLVVAADLLAEVHLVADAFAAEDATGIDPATGAKTDADWATLKPLLGSS